MYLVLEVDQEGMNASEAAGRPVRVKEILYNRIDKFGVSEPEITTFGSQPHRGEAARVCRIPSGPRICWARPPGWSSAWCARYEDLQEALDKLDQLFLGDAVPMPTPNGAAADEAAADRSTGGRRPMAAADETAAAAGATRRQSLRRPGRAAGRRGRAGRGRRSIPARSIPSAACSSPSRAAWASTPLFVPEDNVDRVQAMLDDPRVGAPAARHRVPAGHGSHGLRRRHSSCGPLYLVDAKRRPDRRPADRRHAPPPTRTARAAGRSASP